MAYTDRKGQKDGQDLLLHAVVRGDRLLVCRRPGGRELFHRCDRRELTDLSGAHPERVTELEGCYRDLESRLPSFVPARRRIELDSHQAERLRVLGYVD